MADKIKSLSQAIRVGATYHPQCKGTLYLLNQENIISTCALGAAAEAVGIDMTNLMVHTIRHELSNRFPCLRDFKEGVSLMTTIENCNDRDGWSREGIADWLEEKGL